MNTRATEWVVYLLQCADGTYYTGITTAIQRRVAEHNGELAGGARYTRSRRPVRLVWQQKAAHRSEAAQQEYRVRRLPRARKQVLAAQSPSPPPTPE